MLCKRERFQENNHLIFSSEKIMPLLDKKQNVNKKSLQKITFREQSKLHSNEKYDIISRRFGK